MSLQIFRETNQLARSKMKNHSKLLLTIISIFAVFLTSLFFVAGTVQHDPSYRDLPVVASAPILVVGSWNAIAIISISVIFVIAFGEVFASKVKYNFEGRQQKKYQIQSKAVYDHFNQYGHKDYSLQTDELKQGFEYQLWEVKKWCQSQIDSIIDIFRSKIGILNLKLERSERRRKSAEGYLITAKEIIIKLKEELESKDNEIKGKNEELKIWRKVASDVSFKANYKQKQLDKFQTKLDDFVEY